MAQKQISVYRASELLRLLPQCVLELRADANISVRSKNCLNNEKIFTVSDALDFIIREMTPAPDAFTLLRNSGKIA